MARRSPRFEIVRTDAGWHARFIAGNGRKVWWTENYTRHRGTIAAIEAISSGFATRGVDGRLRVRQRDSIVVLILDVDERTDRGHAHP